MSGSRRGCCLASRASGDKCAKILVPIGKEPNTRLCHRAPLFEPLKAYGEASQIEEGDKFRATGGPSSEVDSARGWEA